MDPASLSNLDPKLKETYDRVMGANTATPIDATIQPAATIPQPQTNSDPSTTAPSTPVPDTSMASHPADAPPLSNEQPQTITINQPLPQPTTAAAASAIVTKPHGHSGLIRIFYALGGIVFFVIYIFFWIKIFKVALPF